MFFLLFLAGVLAGIVGYLVGLASLVSYPVLIAIGIPPVLANTSNTVGLLGAGLGSIASAWRRITAIDVYPFAPQAIVGLLGGVAGGMFLLIAEPEVFEAIVPWLVLLATVLVILSPRINGRMTKRQIPFLAFLIIFLAIAIYGGYFGAGSGVLFFALCMLCTPMSAHEAVLMKTPLMFLANLGASIIFIARGEVDWVVALSVGAGTFVGGYLGPKVQRWISETVMRWMVIVGGFVMTVWLLLR